MQVQEVTQKVNAVNWRAYRIAENDNRIFYANTIQFINLGTGDVSINDVITLQPGASQSLECLKNEIDYTPYKITFATGFVNNLQIWAKEDRGSAMITEALMKAGNNPAPRRRDQIKEYYSKRRPGAEF